MRAKEAIKSFRRRSGAGRQERAASAVPRLQADEPVPVNETTIKSTSEGESNTSPVVVISGAEAGKDGVVEDGTEGGEGTVEEDEEETTCDLQDPVSGGLKESNENESGVEDLESEEKSLQT